MRSKPESSSGSLQALAFAVAIAASGCALNRLPPSPQVQPGSTGSRKLCPVPDVPPKAIASKPGYVQGVITVENDAGKPIDGLKESDFYAYVGQQILPIKYFHDDAPSMPTSLAIVIDSSGSMQEKFAGDKSKSTLVREALA